MDKLSRKGFLGVFAGLFAAPAVVKAIPEEPTGGILDPQGNPIMEIRGGKAVLLCGHTPGDRHMADLIDQAEARFCEKYRMPPYVDEVEVWANMHTNGWAT